MELINRNNIYVDIGDNQYFIIQNEYIYDFKNYYFNNEIKIKYSDQNITLSLDDQNLFSS